MRLAKILMDVAVVFLFLVVFAALLLIVLPQGRWIASAGFMIFGGAMIGLLAWSQSRGHEFFFERCLRRSPLLVLPVLVGVVGVSFFVIINTMVVGYESLVECPFPDCTAYTTWFPYYF